jgi:glycosyltransferase involved in cell wall biosynthesis
MLQTATVTFAISRVLRDDLAARTQQPVLYSPNALSSDFITAMRPGQSFVPAELLNLPRPIVGCTGQINETYDWAMLGELADRMPEASFVFIGPIIAEAAEHRTAIDAVLKGKPNVHWLGRKPHADLPAYLGAFDVCLNPLAPGPHADRRSPLRLFDYLATGKPIVSTNIAEARHDGHVWLADNATEMAALIRQGYSGERQLDLPARQKYIEQNTWEMRALDMLAKIESSTKIRMTKFE